MRDSDEDLVALRLWNGNVLDSGVVGAEDFEGFHFLCGEGHFALPG